MILVIDNYDSFTFNLVQYLGELGADPMVKRNDQFSVGDVRKMGVSAIVISPGPGSPVDAGVSIDVIREHGDSVPILGVCLGHQAIAEAYGGCVVRADKLMHGKTSLIDHESSGLFAGIETPLEVMRYHSLTVEASTLPACLVVSAWAVDNKDEIHAVRHLSHPVWGVQFHPESVMTHGGKRLLANFLRLAQ